MSAAAFVMAINIFITGVFATAFGVVAAYTRSSNGARWLALAYGLGMLSPVFEFMLPQQSDPRPLQVAIFAVVLLGVCFCVAGLARHYRLRAPWRTLGTIVVVSLIANILALDMPRTSLLRGFIYQLPFFFVQMVGAAVILRFRHRQPLDVALLVLFLLGGLQFLVKPLLAVSLGSGTSAAGYLGTTYAAISQSLGAMLLIATGLLMLLILVRDAMAEMHERSETDKLSGLYNRRGFEERAGRMLQSSQRASMPGAVVIADLDHFKTVNDSFGHEAGDRVIEAFASMLNAAANGRATVGRLGGEEFAVFMPGANLATARLYAEGVRTGISGLLIHGLPAERRITASFGVAQLQPDDSLSDLLRRGDAALYEAKKGGRDRVCIADDAVGSRLVSSDRRQGSRSRP